MGVYGVQVRRLDSGTADTEPGGITYARYPSVVLLRSCSTLHSVILHDHTIRVLHNYIYFTTVSWSVFMRSRKTIYNYY